MLGYDVARDTMYAKIDLDPDGFVRGIYTGFAVEYTGGDPSTQMFNGGDIVSWENHLMLITRKT